MTVLDSLDECARSLTSEPAPRRDVVLVEAKMLRSCLSDKNSVCACKFPSISEKTAIVILQRDDSDAKEQEFIAHALANGAAGILRYPLMKKNVANLWQHAVRKMITSSGDEKMLAVLKRSSSSSNVHNFERPFCRGINVLDTQAYGESVLRSPTPPMSLEAMNARQAQLLAESELRKAKVVAAVAAKQQKAKSKTAANGKSAQDGVKRSAARKKAQARDNISVLSGSSPDDSAFMNVFSDLPRSLATSNALDDMPIGLHLNSDSFSLKLQKLNPEVDSEALKTAMYAPFGPDGSYPGVSAGFSTTFGGPESSMGDDYDALDYVLNSNDISLTEPIDDEMIYQALAQ